MKIKQIQLVSPLLEEVDDASQKLIEDPSLKEVEVSQGLIVVRANVDLSNHRVVTTHQKDGQSFAVTLKKR